MSPSSKSAKRGSWGASNNQQNPLPDQWLYPNDEAHDGFPNRELLATTADCLRIWECARNADSIPPWEEVDGGQASMEDEESATGGGYHGNNYVGNRRPRNSNPGKLRFNLREKSVLAHVSMRQNAHHHVTSSNTLILSFSPVEILHVTACAFDVLFMESSLAQSHRNLFHRHHLHSMGSSHENSPHPAHRTRSRSLRCGLVSRLIRRLCLGRRRWIGASV